MSSWREGTSRAAQDELDELLDAALRAARKQLDTVGDFYPFAMTLEQPGTTALVTPEVRTGPREVADPSAVLEQCWVALREQAGGVRATAVVSDVTLSGGEAVSVDLEHAEGVALTVYLPYVTQGKTRGKKPAQKHRFGDLQAAPGEPRVWS